MRGLNEPDWNQIAKAACEAFRAGVNAWIEKAFAQGGSVNGPNAHLTPGSLKSPIPLEGLITEAMLRAKAPVEIARVVARELSSAWTDWANGFQVMLPAIFPQFAAFPGPMAPPTPGRGVFPLAQGTSAGEMNLQARMLSMKLTGALRIHIKPGSGAEAAIDQVTKWVDSSFQEWKRSAQINGSSLLGKGPAPTFAPPYVPTSPVVAGDFIGNPGGTVIGPPFGKILLP